MNQFECEYLLATVLNTLLTDTESRVKALLNLLRDYLENEEGFPAAIQAPKPKKKRKYTKRKNKEVKE